MQAKLASNLRASCLNFPNSGIARNVLPHSAIRTSLYMGFVFQFKHWGEPGYSESRLYSLGHCSKDRLIVSSGPAWTIWGDPV